MLFAVAPGLRIGTAHICFYGCAVYSFDSAGNKQLRLGWSCRTVFNWENGKTKAATEEFRANYLSTTVS